MEELLRDSANSKVLRQKMAAGEMTESDRGDIPLVDWKVLLKMWRRKTEQTPKRSLEDIEPDEWHAYLKKHAKITSSPGGSGTGSSVLKEAPEIFPISGP